MNNRKFCGSMIYRRIAYMNNIAEQRLLLSKDILRFVTVVFSIQRACDLPEL